MALFALREGYRVETTPTGGRVVHVRTGDTLELNFNEIQLLARAAAGGVEVGDPNLKHIVRKLSGLGLLERVSNGDDPPAAGGPPEAAPDGAQVEEGLWVFAPPQDSSPPPAAASPETTTEVAELPKPAPIDPNVEPTLDFAAPAEPERPAEPPPSLQSPELLVPIFRADLVLKRKDKGGVYDVTDPTNGKTFAFYDFEISIARMLNGQRRFGEVVTGANALGIPVSVESLSQFVRQLDRYGFLAPDGTKFDETPPGSIWGKRAKWNNSIRTLFQSGLRLTRQARYYEAAAYFEAILEHDPGNPEALEMLEQVRDHLAKLPADAPPPHPAPELDGELSATLEGLAAVEPEPASESALESLDGSIGDAAAATATDLPLPGPEETSKQPTEVSDLSAALASADQPSDWAELASAPSPEPEPAPAHAPEPAFDPFAEPANEVQPLGLQGEPGAAPHPTPGFDPFAEPGAAAGEPFPAAPIRKRTPTGNPFARPDTLTAPPPRATPNPFARPDVLSAPPPRATPDPFAAIPAPDPGAKASAAKQPFDPFADTTPTAEPDGQQPLESLLDAEPELPQFDTAALEAPPEPAPHQPASDPVQAVVAEVTFELPEPTASAPAPEVSLDLSQAVSAPGAAAEPAASLSLAEVVLEPIPDQAAPAEEAKSLAEAVLEPIPDETMDVDGVGPAPESIPEVEAIPLPIPEPALPAVETLPAGLVLEALPEDAVAPGVAAEPEPAAALDSSRYAFANTGEIVEVPKPADTAPAKPPSSPARPPSGPAKRPSGPAMPAPKIAPPPSSTGKFIFGGLGLAALAGGAVWFFALRTPQTPQPPPKPPVVAVAGPDAAQAAAVPGLDAAVPAVESAGLDAAAVVSGPNAAAEAGPDAATAGPDAAAPGLDAAQAGLDAAAAAAAAPAGGDEGWVAVDVAKRGRVNMGNLKAPVAGTVTWGVPPNQERIKKGQVIGKIADADGNEVALMSPNVGLLAPRSADGSAVQANDVIASVPYFEAYGQTPFPGPAAPAPEWRCEVVDEATSQKAPCKVNKADPRKGGFYVTFTTEPLWFDTAAKVKLRLKAP
ncbi:MAG: hypothetical protein QM765_14455 [Myxococcales bacterium]